MPGSAPNRLKAGLSEAAIQRRSGGAARAGSSVQSAAIALHGGCVGELALVDLCHRIARHAA
jgi:hypothetical protein